LRLQSIEYDILAVEKRTIKNKKVLAKNSLKEIREIFKASGITDAEFQASGMEIRWEIIKEYYFSPEQKTPSYAPLPQGRRNVYVNSLQQSKFRNC
jgi:hypothetical protein